MISIFSLVHQNASKTSLKGMVADSKARKMHHLCSDFAVKNFTSDIN